VPRQWFALVYVEIGDEANTAKWLNRSADAHEWQVLNAAVHPFYKNMQNSPEFHALKTPHWARTLNGRGVCRLEPRGARMRKWMRLRFLDRFPMNR
jgi:hypothetical protein